MSNSFLLTSAELNALHQLATFLALRDVPTLNTAPANNPDKTVIILLGNSLLCSVDIAARAWHAGTAPRILISGGRGHATDFLRRAVQSDSRYADIPVDDRAEADILRDLLVHHFSVPASCILIENQSTNCGSNAVEALQAARAAGPFPARAILIQDPTLQRRTDASFRKAWRGTGTQFINFAPWVPELIAAGGKLRFAATAPHGIWTLPRFLSLVMGEIPRLRDDAHGYGPLGRDFIAHVEIPPAIETAFACLRAPLAAALESRLAP